MQELELEKTYLIKDLPRNLAEYPSKEIIDVYIPQKSEHPVLRIRKSGEKYEITKKIPQGADVSTQMEHTIKISEDEFNALLSVEGKKIRKTRYYYPFQERTAEIDVFQDELKGLVLVDFEFKTEEEKNSFIMPEFCLVDITQEKFIAGGMLSGKTYEDIQERLQKWKYTKFIV